MLTLHIGVGESVLARGTFELRFLGYGERSCRFSLTVLALTPYTVFGPGGSVAGSNVRPGEPHEFEVGLGARLRIKDVVVNVWAHRKEAVKLAIDAPKSISFCRPAQHGGSLTAV